MKLFIVILSIAFGSTSFALSGDMTKQVADCRWLAPVPDIGMRVTVTEGGLAGLTQLQVTRFYLGQGSNIKTYIVRKAPSAHNTNYRLVIYQGENAKLQINLGARPNAENRYPAILETLDGEKHSQDKLACLVK